MKTPNRPQSYRCPSVENAASQVGNAPAKSRHLRLSIAPGFAGMRGQQGATLIVVLFALMLIAVVGVIAVRQSGTSLQIATGDQIDALLRQSADNTNNNIEQGVNGSVDATAYRDMISLPGMFGHFMLNQNNRENEYVFCFRPRDRFLDIRRTTIIVPDGGTLASSSAGYCNPQNADDYSSNRQTVMTQVNVTMTPPDASQGLFKRYTPGQDVSSVSGQTYMYNINSTAILPAFADVGNCLENTSQVDKIPDLSTHPEKSIGGCLSQAGVPNVVLHQQADLSNISFAEKCVDYGVGAGVICTLPAGTTGAGGGAGTGG